MRIWKFLVINFLWLCYLWTWMGAWKRFWVLGLNLLFLFLLNICINFKLCVKAFMLFIIWFVVIYIIFTQFSISVETYVYERLSVIISTFIWLLNLFLDTRLFINCFEMSASYRNSHIYFFLYWYDIVDVTGVLTPYHVHFE